MLTIIILTVVAVTAASPQNRFGNQQNQQFNEQPNNFNDEAFSQNQEDYGSLENGGILRMENIHNDDGSFQYGFETANNIQQDVAGQIKQIGEEFGVVMQGSYSYTVPDENGQDVTYTVTWTADENGFQAEGDGIPGSPQINEPQPFQPEDQFSSDRGGPNRFN